jgi:Domain of unknown function (DUF4397)
MQGPSMSFLNSTTGARAHAADRQFERSSLTSTKVPRLLRLVALVVAVLSSVALVGSAAYASTSSGSGWLRFGHFVANEPPVDVNVDGNTIATDVAFRDVTGYVPVNAGSNTVTISAASAGAGSSPIASITATVPSGGAVTVAAFASTGVTSSSTGSVAGGITLQVFTDDLSAPPAGDAKVRVIHTIPGAPVVTAQLTATAQSSGTPSINLGPVGYKQASPYVALAAGTYQVLIKTSTGTVVTEGQNWQAVAGTVISIVIVEAPTGPSLEILSDAAGASTSPNGAMQTGFGGTAQRGSLARSAILPIAGSLLVVLLFALFLRARLNRPVLVRADR